MRIFNRSTFLWSADKNGINAVYASLSLSLSLSFSLSLSLSLSKSVIKENLWGESTDAAVRADIIDSLVRDNVDNIVRVSVTLYSPARGPP